MEYTNIETPLTAQSGSQFFGDHYFRQGKQLLQEGKINVSFRKGSPERYFIISGIILTNPKHRTKLSVKNQEGQYVISGQCDCHEWNDKKQCPHVAALFLKFFRDQDVLEQSSGSGSSTDPHALAIKGGCHTDQYGKIITAPGELINASLNSTYAGMQFVLRNGQVVHFPLIHDFHGKVIINFTHPTKERPEYHSISEWHHLWTPSFSYQQKEGKIQEYISLFEYLYIFNWDSGEAFHTPNDLKTLIKKLKNNYYLLSGNEILRSTQQLRQREMVEIQFNGKPFDFEQAFEPHIRVSAEQASRKTFFALSIELYNDDKELLTAPEFMKSFVYTNGLLDSFRTKGDAVKFVQSYLDLLNENSFLYRHHIHSSGKKKQLKDWTDELKDKDEIYFMASHGEKLYRLQSDKVLKLFQSILQFFGEAIIKNSTYNYEERRIVYLIPKNQFFLGVSSFYQKLQSLDIPLFFQERQVRRWTSSVRFERTRSELDWFDLNLHATAQDLEMIKQADMDNGHILTEEGLVLLSDQDKELLRFLKKYTKHEGQEKPEEADEQGIHTFKLNLKRARIFELFELKKMGIEGALTQEEIELCENLANLEEVPQSPIPANFINVARPYQITGYHWLRFLYQNRLRACLADDMGLGKTIQAIMFLQSILDQVQRVLIVCPVSILMNWKYEIERFGNFDADIYYGGDRSLNTDAKVIITSYGVMRKEAEETFKDLSFNVLIFDEVQHLKNIRSQGAHAARNIQANFRICLTGTPVENDLSEFYNILDLCLPGLWGETSFIKSRAASKTRLLAKKTAKPFILRRSKEDVLSDLPEKEEHYVYLHFDEAEDNRYKKHLKVIQQRLSNKEASRRYGEVLKSLLEMRQMCLWQQHQAKEILSTKVDFLIENLEQILEEKHKVIIFSQFTTYLNIIEERVKQMNWKFSRIDGSQTMKTRIKHIENFQEGDSEVFLISLKAGGVGLNLTAASYIFLMDPWWNPAVERQAIDRAHRIGQKNKVTVYRPIIKNSIEEKVIKLQESKRELFQDLMATDDRDFYSGKLSMDDFKELLEIS